MTREPRRLLHVFPNFDVGGAQVRFASLVEGLGEAFEHTVLALNGNYDAAALLPAGAPVRFAPAPPTPARLVARIQRYRADLAARRPDLLLTYNWGATEMALAGVVARTPHLHMQDGFGPEEAHRQLRRRVWLRRLALARAHVAVPSVTLEEIAVRTWGLDPSRVHHIPNGVAPKLHPARSLRQLGVDVPGGAPLIAWIGALRPEKNPGRLMRAYAPLKDRAVLLVIGSGPEHDSVVREAAALGLGSRLRLLGPRADARDILMHCHLAALSSDTEQMPLVVLEAMDAGLPVASCDVGDVRRMLTPENRPFVTPLDDEALGAAMRRLLLDAGLRQRIGHANRQRVRTLYTRPRMVEAHTALIARLAAGRATASRLPPSRSAGWRATKGSPASPVPATPVLRAPFFAPDRAARG